ncbi:ATP-binding cassette domain-containing protein [Nocardioides mangrovicus]|uniref:ATP-binding cassette domain-containing protein n=2 Tax=Nocardioides mangrovicus TaxID=2478913 RepID=A0A3L8NZ86_9ACTN|nr:ATP-binding cassette domain-containing protein [Nocardioides mangrovicus]
MGGETLDPPAGSVGDEAVLRLEIQGASKHFAGVAALKDVSLSVRAGEVHAVLGENGAGKSTLMNIATGTLQPDEGEIRVGGEVAATLTPARATALGIAIVHQHPAVMPDLTVQENLQVALPAAAFAGGARQAAERMLARVGLEVDLADRVETLTLAERHLLEIAKAFAVDPRVLILDEPTAPLGNDASELLFDLVRSAVAEGTSVVYITHRLAEVRELADTVTVLRDGRLRGNAVVADISDQELLNLIVGRELESTFPAKSGGDGEENLSVEGFSGPGFGDVSLVARRGEIVGVAGVVGNGQSQLLRGLAGLEETSGTVSVGGRRLDHRELLGEAAYMPADRITEGLMRSLSVRENAALSALSSFRSAGFLSRRREVSEVRGSLGSLSVRAPSLEAPVSALSGGNQQKVVISRALLADPPLLLADEPTQGVDVGARSEIYTILRAASERGVPVIIASSDAKELEGLCDRVVVMSRGRVVETLVGEEVTEERIVSAAVTSTAETVSAAAARRATRSSRLRRFVEGDYSPSALLVVLMLALAAYITPGNERYLSAFNISNVLLAATAIGFIALGQNLALLTGGIDLSVGPLAGFLVVVSSFYVLDRSGPAKVLLGFVLMVLVAAVVGLVNGSLVRFARFTPIAATLTLYIALGGFAFLLRSTQGGYISLGFQNAVNLRFGPLPVAFVVFVVLAVVMELALRRRRWGWRLRGVGSDEDAARRVGIDVDRTVIGAYVCSSLLAFLGALMFMGQYGIGDPSQGSAFTLTSVTAVVLGGTSLLGGRGTFIGTLAGAVLLQQLLNATTFLGLGSTSQYYFQGLLILVAAVVYTLARSRRRGRPAAG